MCIFSFFSWKPSKLDLREEMDSRSHFRIITINKNKEYLTEFVGLDEVIMFSFTISERYFLKGSLSLQSLSQMTEAAGVATRFADGPLGEDLGEEGP